MKIRKQRQDFLIEMLKKEFETKRSKNKSYSLRAYANYLEMDPSNLSKIMRYDLVPRLVLRKRLAEKLGFADKELTKLVHDKHIHPYELETFKLISDWYHYAILELIQVPTAKMSVNWLSKSLGLTKNTITEALKRMEKLDLIRSENGVYINNTSFSSSITTTQTSKAHRDQQKQILEKAIVALEEVPLEFRSQSSMTMAIDRNKLDEAKELIKEFRRNLAVFLTESNQLNDVYNLTVSLYPVTMFHKEEP